MGMVDGVNKIFVVEYRHSSMQFVGYQDEAALCEAMLYRMGIWDADKDTAQRQRDVYDLAKRVCERIGQDNIEPGEDDDEHEDEW